MSEREAGVLREGATGVRDPKEFLVRRGGTYLGVLIDFSE